MARQARLPVNDLGRSWIVGSPDVRHAVVRVASSGWYVHGPGHAAFEIELARYIGVRHVAGVASGTDALVLAMLAVGCGPGSEIVAPPNAGGYKSGAAAQIGTHVVYCGVDPVTLLATNTSIGRAIGPSTRAVVVTHLSGKVADVSSRCHYARSSVLVPVKPGRQLPSTRATQRESPRLVFGVRQRSTPSAATNATKQGTTLRMWTRHSGRGRPLRDSIIASDPNVRA